MEEKPFYQWEVTLSQFAGKIEAINGGDKYFKTQDWG